MKAHGVLALMKGRDKYALVRVSSASINRLRVMLSSFTTDAQFQLLMVPVAPLRANPTACHMDTSKVLLHRPILILLTLLHLDKPNCCKRT